jgi:divalent metal cation (Fe/Co/Zn/Cd) transporter
MNWDNELDTGTLILIGLGLIVAYLGIGWLSILISSNQGWFAGIGVILIIIGLILQIVWYLLKQKVKKIDEISKELTDNWK